MPVGTTYTFFNNFVEPTEILDSDGDFAAPLFGLGKTVVTLVNSESSQWMFDFTRPDINVTVHPITASIVTDIRESIYLQNADYGCYYSNVRIYKDKIYFPVIIGTTSQFIIGLVVITYNFDSKTVSSVETLRIGNISESRTTITSVTLRLINNKFFLNVSAASSGTWCIDPETNTSTSVTSVSGSEPSLFSNSMYLTKNMYMYTPYTNTNIIQITTSTNSTVYVCDHVMSFVYRAKNKQLTRLTIPSQAFAAESVYVSPKCTLYNDILVNVRYNSSYMLHYLPNQTLSFMPAKSEGVATSLQYFTNGYACVGYNNSSNYLYIFRPLPYI